MGPRFRGDDGGFWDEASAPTRLSAAMAPSKRPGLCGPGLPQIKALCRSASYQAAGLKIFEALVLIGSALSVATFWASSASSLLCAVKDSNDLRVCEVSSSTASEGDFTPIRAWARSRLAEAASFIISMTLAEYSLAPLA